MKTLLVLLVPLVLSHAVEVPPPPVDKLDDKTCEGLGFTQALACSTCKNIEDIVANEGLTEECLRCCHETKHIAKKYASARLVYDPRLLRADAELRGFIEDRAANHPALTLQPSMHANTVLLMSEEGASEADADTVSIRRWKVDSIADYLHEHL